MQLLRCCESTVLIWIETIIVLRGRLFGHSNRTLMFLLPQPVQLRLPWLCYAVPCLGPSTCVPPTNAISAIAMFIGE